MIAVGDKTIIHINLTPIIFYSEKQYGEILWQKRSRFVLKEVRKLNQKEQPLKALKFL